jgi:hypothetical protein
VAIALTTTGKVDYGDLAAIDGLTALSVCLTIKLAGSVAGVRFMSKWGNTIPGTDQAFLISRSTADIGWLVSANQRRVTTTTGLVTAGALLRLVFRWNTSGDLITVWANGVAQTTGAATGTDPASINTTTTSVQIGQQSAESQAAVDGDYAEAALFGRYLTDEEATAYGKGVSPARLGRSNRILYARLLNTTDLTNLWAGTAGALTGGANATHPTMIYAPPRATRPTASAVTGGRVIGGGVVIPVRNRLVVA